MYLTYNNKVKTKGNPSGSLQQVISSNKYLQLHMSTLDIIHKIRFRHMQYVYSFGHLTLPHFYF